MKNYAVVAVLLSVVSLPAFAQSKFIKEANSKVTDTDASAPAQVEKAKKVEPAEQADEREVATDATGEAEPEALATGEASPDLDATADETATDAAAELEKPDVER